MFKSSIIAVKHGPARRRPTGVRSLSAALAVCVLAVSSSAYTLVMRGGRRVEVPEKFLLTKTTLTFEAAPGINVTLQLAHVDIEATERENREPQGGFFRHVLVQNGPARLTPAKVSTERRIKAARVLTNRELESVRRARIESEEGYERRRKELGLPTVEETQRRAREDARYLRERGRREEEKEAETEGYWRRRAGALREEMRALDAEINYLRATLAEQPASYAAGVAVGTTAVLSGFTPFLHTQLPPLVARTPVAGLGGVNFGAFQTNGVGSIATAQLGGDLTFGGAVTNAQGGFVRRDVRGIFARRLFGDVFTPGLIGVGVPSNYYTAEGSALLTRLRLLEAERAGLEERWQLLEEEARRAGALPGWLRP